MTPKETVVPSGSAYHRVPFGAEAIGWCVLCALFLIPAMTIGAAVLPLSPKETVVPSGSVYQPRSRISMVC